MFKKFWPSILFRVILLSISCLFTAFFWISNDYPINRYIWSVITILLTLHIGYFLYNLIESIELFILGLLNNDFSSIPFRKYKNRKFKKLKNTLDEVGKSMKRDSSENLGLIETYKTAIEIAPVGLLMWKDDGEIVFANNKFKDLLGIEGIQTITRLKSLRPLFTNKLNSIMPGYSGVFEYIKDGNSLKLSGRKTILNIGEADYNLIAIQTIGSELEVAEETAWSKLLKIMTHEIMNSVTSIHSLSSSMAGLIDTGNTEDINRAIQSIEKRSQGLMQFVTDYRTLSEIPAPNIERIDLEEILSEFTQDMSGTDGEIEFHTKVKANLLVLADPNQIQLVLTNLFLNALHAMKDKRSKTIWIETSAIGNNKISVEFRDNGAGMSEEIKENAFVPFYTTRDDGAGIGLPLSRQMIRAMGGSLHLDSSPGLGTSVFIVLKKSY